MVVTFGSIIGCFVVVRDGACPVSYGVTSWGKYKYYFENKQIFYLI